MIQGEMGMISGMKIISSPHLPRFKIIQFRFPKTKRKRIQKKWAKDPKNSKQVPFQTMYMFGNTAIMRPDEIARIENFVAETNKYHFMHGDWGALKYGNFTI